MFLCEQQLTLDPSSPGKPGGPCGPRSPCRIRKVIKITAGNFLLLETIMDGKGNENKYVR